LAELVLLSFDRGEIAALHRASINGEPEAVRFFETLWQDHRDKALACFSVIARSRNGNSHPTAQSSPTSRTPTKAVGCPLCERCRELPQLVRWNRCMKMLRAMHKVKTGKNRHYVFSPVNRQPHPIPSRRRGRPPAR